MICDLCFFCKALSAERKAHSTRLFKKSSNIPPDSYRGSNLPLFHSSNLPFLQMVQTLVEINVKFGV